MGATVSTVPLSPALLTVPSIWQMFNRLNYTCKNTQKWENNVSLKNKPNQQTKEKSKQNKKSPQNLFLSTNCAAHYTMNFNHLGEFLIIVFHSFPLVSIS